MCSQGSRRPTRKSSGREVPGRLSLKLPPELADSRPALAQERRSLCLELFRLGLRPHEVATAVGLSERVVRRHLRAAGVPDLRRRTEPPPEPTSRPLRAVRLTDVPVETRLEAADRLILTGTATGAEAREVLLAASWPSSQSYWVAG
jgi:AraC-like DNA-binding protein